MGDARLEPGTHAGNYARPGDPAPFDAENPDNITIIIIIVDGETTWTFDSAFLTSNWECIRGRGAG
jgi:hypothetical protein